jgi:N utilization substance protein B
VLGALPVVPDDLTVELVRGVGAHTDRIDAVLTRLVAPRWTLGRLAAVDRAILRIGAYELFEVHDRSQALVINEAVVLARRFGTDDSPRFVNGVLAAVASESRPTGTTAAPDPADPPDPSDDAGGAADPAPPLDSFNSPDSTDDAGGAADG